MGPHVLVSLGTLNWHNGGRFFTAAAEANGMDAHGIVARRWRRPCPTSWRCPTCSSWRCCRGSAVVRHGGHNTVCEALAHGLPLVVALIRDDQPAIAAQVEAAGACASCSAGPDRTPAALASALGDPGLRAGAERSGGRSQPGGPAAAADELERSPAVLPAIGSSTCDPTRSLVGAGDLDEVAAGAVEDGDRDRPGIHRLLGELHAPGTEAVELRPRRRPQTR